MSITVRSGAAEWTDHTNTQSGKTVEQIYNNVKGLMELQDKSKLKPEINGAPADWSDVVEGRDELEFKKATGEKGC